MKETKLNGTHHLSTSVDINAPRDKVWELMRGFTDVSWAPGVKASHAIGNSVLGEGAGRHCVLEGFGEIDEYITQWSEGEGYVYSVSPLGPMTNFNSAWTVSSVGSKQSRLTIAISYDIRFGIFGKLMHRYIMRKKLETSLPQTTMAFKTRAESIVKSELKITKGRGKQMAGIVSGTVSDNQAA
mgnify:CR=1 FL=1